ncbi:MAG: DUF58 domain-containing protein [Woeseiaceae bacterium]|nr:DUF58 domain-containing protein [Woeseiaceae bacterium]
MSLSPRAVALAALIAAIGIVSTWNPDVLQAAWKIGAALFLFGLIYEWVIVQRNRPAVALDDDAPLYLGRRIDAGLAFTNAGGRVLELRYAPALPDGLSGSIDNRRVMLPPGTTVDRVPAQAVRLGRTTWGTLPAMLTGPLGLARWSLKLKLDEELRIIPDTLGNRGTQLASSDIGTESRTQVGSGMELHHLRPYRRGDAPSSIDWKATARSGDLITRVFGEDQHLEIILCLDAGRTSRLEMDGMAQVSHYVNLAARFAEYAAVAEDRVGLVVFSDRIHEAVQPQRGIKGVRGIRAALTDLEPRLTESDLTQAALKVRTLARHRSLVILLTSLYDRGANPALKRFVSALSPKHLPIVVGTMSEEVSALADRDADDWFDPYRSLAAQEYRRDLQANAAVLTRMGAYTVTSRPSVLDSRVMGLYDRLKARHLI